MFDSLALVVFPLLMMFAALADLFTMEIPNRVSVLLIVFYFGLALYLHEPAKVIALHASCGVAMLAITLGLYYFRQIGGGDAKLAAATALWLGWGLLYRYSLIASIIGGALTLAIMELRRREEWQAKLRKFAFVSKLAESNCVPYGIALALAGLIVYPQTSVWLGLAGIR